MGAWGAWETVLAAAGGLVLGIGIGLVIARIRERALSVRLQRERARVRASVVPVLEARAQQLGIPVHERQSFSEDPIELAVGLSVSIMRTDSDPNLAFSDTVELARADLDSSRRKKGAQGG